MYVIGHLYYLELTEKFLILLPLSILTTFSLLVRLRKEPFNQLARDNKDKPVQDNFGVAH